MLYFSLLWNDIEIIQNRDMKSILETKFTIWENLEKVLEHGPSQLTYRDTRQSHSHRIKIFENSLTTNMLSQKELFRERGTKS